MKLGSAEIPTSLDPKAIAAGQTGPAYQVRLYNGKNKRQFYGPLDQPKTVLMALQESGAIKEFPRMEVKLVRSIPGSEPLKLPVFFQADERKVESSTDYAVHPGDIIIVKKDNSNMISRTLDGVSSKLGIKSDDK